jgi:hypothetical protein
MKGVMSPWTDKEEQVYWFAWERNSKRLDKTQDLRAKEISKLCE